MKVTPVVSNSQFAHALTAYLKKQIALNGGEWDYYEVENAIRYLAAGFGSSSVLRINTGGTPPCEWFTLAYPELDYVAHGFYSNWKKPVCGATAPLRGFRRNSVPAV